MNDIAERSVLLALARGWRRRCPNCGAGPLMNGYLTLRQACSSCGEDLHHARTDDGPAYLTILIVGHLMVPLMLHAFIAYNPDPTMLAIVFGIACTALSLYLLPRLKGVVLAFQWAKRMHGFGGV